MKNGTSFGMIGSLQCAGETFGETAADGEAEAEAVGFGGGERLEKVFQLDRGKAWSVVVHADDDLVVLNPAGDFDQSGGVRGLHGIQTVDHQIHEDLLDFYQTGPGGREVWGELEVEADVTGDDFAIDEVEDLVDGGIESDRFAFGGGSFSEHGAHAMDDAAGAFGIGGDIIEDVEQLEEGGGLSEAHPRVGFPCAEDGDRAA